MLQTLKTLIIILILLQEIFEEYEFDEHLQAIHNMNETGMSLEPCPLKKGQKRVRCQTLGHKQQTTSIGCGSATGNVILLFIIFAAKQVNYVCG